MWEYCQLKLPNNLAFTYLYVQKFHSEYMEWKKESIFKVIMGENNEFACFLFSHKKNYKEYYMDSH